MNGTESVAEPPANSEHKYRQPDVGVWWAHVMRMANSLCTVRTVKPTKLGDKFVFVSVFFFLSWLRQKFKRTYHKALGKFSGAVVHRISMSVLYMRESCDNGCHCDRLDALVNDAERKYSI